MLDIIVNGQRIAIERGTSIQVEFNSSIFSTDGIEGDVAYSFDVPAAPNDLIFESARFVYVQRRRKYACTILLAGTPIGNGNLYVTKATKDTYSCELAVNAFPDGWRDRKLRDNDYGDDIIISDNYANHKQNWLAFLQSTLADDSVVKFPLFLDEDYYDDNEDFGYWEGQETFPIGKVEGNLQKDFVNRLSFRKNGDDNIVEEAPTYESIPAHTPVDSNSGWRIFQGLNVISEEDEEQNISRRTERNQYSFAPAIKLAFIFQKLVESAGYSAIGQLLNNSDFNAIFHQSLQSMDGSYSDYDEECKMSVLTCDQSLSAFDKGLLNHGTYPVDLSLEPGNNDCVELHSYGQYPVYFRPLYFGSYKFTIDIEFNKTEATVIGSTPSSNHPETYPNNDYTVIEICVRKWTASPSNSYGRTTTDEIIRPLYQADDSQIPYTGEGVLFHNLAYLSNYYVGTESGPHIRISAAANGTYKIHCQFYANIDPEDVGENYCIVFDKITLREVEHFVNTEPTGDYISTYVGQYDLKYGYCKMNCVLDYRPTRDAINNIFTNKLRWKQHMPDMSNSELLQTLASMFGLAIYVDSVGRSMEFSFIKDIQDAQCLNLTSYYLSSETAINEKESKQYKSSLTPLSSSDFSDESLIDEVQHKEQLPDAEDHIGSAALVRDQNRYFVAEKEGDAYTNWKYVWKENGTNKEVLKVGDEDANSTEDITPAAKIPSMGILKHCEPTVPFVCECSNSVDQTLIFSQCIRFPVIQGGCISFLNSSKNSTLDLILMRYIGQYAIPYRFEFDFGENGKMTTAYVSAFSNGVRYYELMSPVCYGDDGERLPGNDLAATGEHSIGEVYVKPWLQLLSNYEKITYRFLLPPAKLLEVIRLFRPQDAAPENQVRWIFVENVRVLPIRMTFEIVEGKDQILTEIECAKPVV